MIRSGMLGAVKHSGNPLSFKKARISVAVFSIIDTRSFGC